MVHLWSQALGEPQGRKELSDTEIDVESGWRSGSDLGRNMLVSLRHVHSQNSRVASFFFATLKHSVEKKHQMTTSSSIKQLAEAHLSTSSTFVQIKLKSYLVSLQIGSEL